MDSPREFSCKYLLYRITMIHSWIEDSQLLNHDAWRQLLWFSEIKMIRFLPLPYSVYALFYVGVGFEILHWPSKYWLFYVLLSVIDKCVLFEGWESKICLLEVWFHIKLLISAKYFEYTQAGRGVAHLIFGSGVRPREKFSPSRALQGNFTVPVRALLENLQTNLMSLIRCS